MSVRPIWILTSLLCGLVILASCAGPKSVRYAQMKPANTGTEVAQTQAPKTKISATEAPTTEAPTTEAPTTEAPQAQVELVAWTTGSTPQRSLFGFAKRSSADKDADAVPADAPKSRREAAATGPTSTPRRSFFRRPSWLTFGRDKADAVGEPSATNELYTEKSTPAATVYPHTAAAPIGPQPPSNLRPQVVEHRSPQAFENRSPQVYENRSPQAYESRSPQAFENRPSQAVDSRPSSTPSLVRRSRRPPPDPAPKPPQEGNRGRSRAAWRRFIRHHYFGESLLAESGPQPDLHGRAGRRLQRQTIRS